MDTKLKNSKMMGMLVLLSTALSVIIYGIAKYYQGYYVWSKLYSGENISYFMDLTGESIDQIISSYHTMLYQITNNLKLLIIVLLCGVAVLLSVLILMIFFTKVNSKRHWYDYLPCELFCVVMAIVLPYFKQCFEKLFSADISDDTYQLFFRDASNNYGGAYQWNILLTGETLKDCIGVGFLAFIVYGSLYVMLCQIKRKEVSNHSMIYQGFLIITKHKMQYPRLNEYHIKKSITYLLQLLLLCYEVCMGLLVYYSQKDVVKWGQEVILLLMVGVPIVCETLILWRESRGQALEREVIVLKQKIERIIGIDAKESSSAESGQNPFDESDILYELGEALTHLEERFQESLQEEMKNEKLKVDLLTNISHDLKTPLTSMIGYIDLLLKEDETELPVASRDYVLILQKKAENLRTMIINLIDLSKVTSGNKSFQREKLDLNRLVEQTIGDMEEEIANSGTVLKVDCSKEELAFVGDGQQLYHVIRNLLDNAIKYSLKGTRIYITTSNTAGMLDKRNSMFTSEKMDQPWVEMKIQNVASYPMDFCADDIVGRFVRGDESRAGTGNGLGLAIAKSYVEACQGRFMVEIDGDTFKAVMLFPAIDNDN